MWPPEEPDLRNTPLVVKGELSGSWKGSKRILLSAGSVSEEQTEGRYRILNHTNCWRASSFRAMGYRIEGKYRDIYEVYVRTAVLLADGVAHPKKGPLR